MTSLIFNKITNQYYNAIGEETANILQRLLQTVERQKREICCCVFMGSTVLKTISAKKFNLQL